MLPMSLGMGEGGEQNAPLGRAVIGGLLFATVTTLFVVPIIYSYLRTKAPVDHERQLLEEEGVRFDEAGRVDLKRTQWSGPDEAWCHAHGLLPPAVRPQQGTLF
jgi:hypothetical protein